MHVFKCAACEKEFKSEKRELKCPFCGSKVLIHVSGEKFNSKSCGGNCSCCNGCGS
ncbi:hypothetical protein Dpep_1891 [Dethiosulfovibrio peptidovorans DSM 11002]|uniref:Regulatory protein, FmdB family n=1 Tax=Dethiosulfovibrio peptidovorans DSM 11002 TaxID=469381 RepID=D2Z8W8_9BACT|nr:hypothetical protein [Dethiosulfovibrio peptidovorans]EFC91915.1 hypothetical protein Dpep_1891 [Dethiosulfovibrio peptidovorans DSM 11002]